MALLVYPDMNSTFIDGRDDANRSDSSTPLMSGITTSVSIRWIVPRNREHRAMASPPPDASRTWYPCRWSTVPSHLADLFLVLDQQDGFRTSQLLREGLRRVRSGRSLRLHGAGKYSLNVVPAPGTLYTQMFPRAA